MDESQIQENNQQINQESTSSLPEKPKFTSQSLFIRILIAFIIILLSLSTYFLTQNRNTAAPVSTPQPTTSSSVVPTTNPTANWKTYKGYKQNLSFQYPADMEFTEYKPQGQQEWIIYLQRIDYSSNRYNGLNISINEFPLTSFSDEAIRKKHSSLLLKIGSTTVAGKEAKIIYLTNDQNQPERQFLINTGSNILLVVAGIDHQTTQEEYVAHSKTVDQILSTFKFLDNETQTIDTSNWKTYTNSKYGYSIQYPFDQYINCFGAGNNKEEFFLFAGKDSEKNICTAGEMPTEFYIITKTKYEPPAVPTYETICVTIKSENVVIDGKKATKYSKIVSENTSNCLPSVAYSRSQVFILLKQNDIFLEIYFKGDNQINNQILSTFRFTE